MTNKILLFFLFLSSTSYGENIPPVFWDRDRSQRENYFLVQEVRISDLAPCRKGNCIASAVATGKIKIPTSIEWRPGGANPTSILCEKMGATPKIGYLENGNEISLCLFDDRSSIFGWDLVKILERK